MVVPEVVVFDESARLFVHFERKSDGSSIYCDNKTYTQARESDVSIIWDRFGCIHVLPVCGGF